VVGSDGKGYAAPVWMTFKQARELKANVRTGEHGQLRRLCGQIIRTGPTPVTGKESERAIPFMKGYTVFQMSSRSTACHSITTRSPNRR